MSPLGRQGRSPARSSPVGPAPSGGLQFQQVPIAEALKERPFLTMATEPLPAEEVTISSLARRIEAIENAISSKIFEVNQSIRDLAKSMEGRFRALDAITTDTRQSHARAR